MRVTIVPEDGTVIVDGQPKGGIDCSDLDPRIHAVQIYDTHAEVEWKGLSGRMAGNETLRPEEALAHFGHILDRWHAKVTDAS